MKQRLTKIIPLADTVLFSEKLLNWVQSSSTFMWLDSNQYPQKYASFEKVLAVDVVSEIKTDFRNSFEKLDRYQSKVNDYIFGYLSYDLKNDIENLTSRNYDGLGFPDLYFFQPKKLFFIYKKYVEVHYSFDCSSDIENDLKKINQTELTVLNKEFKNIKSKQRISKRRYLKKLAAIQQHIIRGDTYEINFCMEYYAENILIQPLTVYKKLNQISKPPFASYFKNKNHYLLSATPERFVRKEGNRIISQPIKGTSKRGKNKQEDKFLIQQLVENKKEKAENIMIVDLVRNDLSKTATKGSVKVEELCEVYTFKQVHQLISTITSHVKQGITPVQIIKSLFPMGSMTGAPKISTMKLIEEYEETKRGLYSGSVGYFTPKGDFDFNVVIRSILYNSHKKYLSFSVGGAITSLSNPADEYQECELKARAMQNALQVNL